MILKTSRILPSLCKADYDQLLDMVGALKPTAGSNIVWQSFKITLRASRTAGALKRIEQRLHHTQTTLTLQICKILSYWHRDCQKDLLSLQQENRKLHSEQSDRVTNLSKLLQHMEARIVEAQRTPSHHAIDSNSISLFGENIAHVDLSKRTIKKDQSILRSLTFESQPTRHDAIPEAHRQTLRWALSKSEEDDSSSPKLLTRLDKEGGIFWISGKPGSGKSTFMKFVADEPMTEQAVSNWSYPKAATVVSHYFWSAGTPMQRSQQGLLQTLLFEILRRFPDFIEDVYRSRWDNSLDPSVHKMWSLPELYTALRNIATRDDFPSKLCFFIDGLDEYEGDHLDLCRELKAISKSQNVKLCVSSRPWNVFMDAFGLVDSPQLCLHDLTRRDIELYIQQRLCEHPRWSHLHIEAHHADWLIRETTDRAQGVFLWVFLVTKLLREGLTEYDIFSDLLRRLESFPTDLHVFFSHILQSVEIFYHNKMATSLLMALAADTPLDISIYYFHDMQYDDDDYVFNLTTKHGSRAEYRQKQLQTARRLNGRCRGLLEVNERKGSVTFLHRTVRDFLMLPDIHNMSIEKAPAGFNIDLCLFKAFVAWIKTFGAPMADEHRLRFESNLRCLGFYASRLDEASEKCEKLYLLLDDLDRSISQEGPPAEENLQLLRSELVGEGLVSYMLIVRSRQPNYISSLPVPALVVALFPDDHFGDPREEVLQWPVKVSRTLDCLFEWGEDPNKAFLDSKFLVAKADRTPWTVFLTQTVPDHKVTDRDFDFSLRYKFNSALENGIFKAFLDHGADPNARIARSRRGSDQISVAWADLLFCSFHLKRNSLVEMLYLEILERCLVHSDFTEIIIDPLMPENKTCGRSVLDQFFYRLGTELSWEQSVDGLNFLAKVTNMVLSKLEQPSLIPDIGWPLIEKLFPLNRVEDFKRGHRNLTPDSDASIGTEAKDKKSEEGNDEVRSKSQNIELGISRKDRQSRGDDGDVADNHQPSFLKGVGSLLSWLIPKAT